MTRAILRVLVTAMVAGGLAVGCSSHGTAIGPHGPDAQAPGSDGPAGGGGAAGSGSDAAAAGSGGGGGVTASGGVTAATASTETGGATGSGGSMRAGGATSSGGVTNSGGATSSGGSSASGGSGGKGGAGGSGGATSTGSPDASADKPPATWGTPCSSQDDCVFSTGMYLMCRAPGESIGCGACRMGTSDCTTDADCVGDGGSTSGTMICDPAPRSDCYCFAAMFCVPGCRTNVHCGPGQACNPSHGCQNTCVAGDGTCPVNYSCGAGGLCQQNSCTGDSQCSGFCVKGLCYQTRGTCEPVPV
jgi:hypothetical protein